MAEQGAEGDSVASLVHDMATRLSGIAEEFGRRAAAMTEAPPTPVKEPAGSETTLVARARRLIEQRRLRVRFLPGELFHEPAWDMLLALFVAQADRRVMNVKTLVSFADAPATTSQRWIDHLHKLGLIERVTDIIDRRRIEVQLSEVGDAAIRGYLAAVG